MVKEVEQEGEKRGRREDNGKKTKMQIGAEREIEAWRDGGIGFDTNKSIQQSRKVEMRKGKETELMKEIKP